jgi:hypothetical protein
LKAELTGETGAYFISIEDFRQSTRANEAFVEFKGQSGLSGSGNTGESKCETALRLMPIHKSFRLCFIDGTVDADVPRGAMA